MAASRDEPIDKLQSIFHEALALPSTERAAYLLSVCEGDEALRARAEALLAAVGGPTLMVRPSDDDPPELPMPTLDGFQIVKRVGEGGMGIVWEAVQLSTQRTVALKLIGAAGIGSPRVRARFKREVQLAAKIEHPNVARVYDSGVHAGVCFYSMELVVGGKPLGEFVADQKLGARAVISLMERVCDAVQAAHLRGIIHRDLKPGNVLVTPDGEPKVLDFGLARSLMESAGAGPLTISGDVMGTLDYMSPEQASGRSDVADTRSDVYSLGVILFQLLTQSLPHDMTGSMTERLRRVADEEPRRPRDIHPGFNRELESVLLKCLSREPSGRYASAGELAADLQRFLEGEPLAARPATTLYFLRKRIARHKGRAAIAAAALVVAAGVAVAYVVSIRAEQGRTRVAKEVAERRGQLATERAEQAGAQRALALDTINQLIFAAQKELSRNLADERARVALIEIAKSGLKRLSASADETITPDRSLAAATLVMGDTARNAGDLELAESTYAQAVRLFEAIAAQKPDALQPRPVADPRAGRRDLIVACVRLGRAQLDRGKFGPAEDTLKKAAVALAELRAAGGFEVADEALLIRDAIAVQVSLGDLRLQQGDATEALRRYEEARSLAAGLGAAGEPDLATAFRRQAAAHEKLMEKGEAGAAAGARTAIDAALAIDRRLVAADVNAPDRRRDLNLSLLRSARLALAAGHRPRAASESAEAYAYFDARAAERPDDVTILLDAAEALLVTLRSSDLETRKALTGAAAGMLRTLEALQPPSSPPLAERLNRLRTELLAEDIKVLQSPSLRNILRPHHLSFG